MKHHDRWTIKRSTRSMLWGSALAMLISCALFAGATYAWFFDDNCSASVATVTTADYFGVNVVKKSESEPDTKMLPTSGVYHLESGTYTVTLTWVGDEATRGYYIIGIGAASNENVQYYDPKLTAETTTVSFQLVIAEQNSATLTLVWKGDAGEFEVTTIVSGDTISYPAVTTLFAMSGAEPEPDEPAESGTNETAESESGGTTQPGTEEKNNSEEVPSGTDGGSSGNEGGENGEGGSTVEDTTGSDTGNVPSGVE